METVAQPTEMAVTEDQCNSLNTNTAEILKKERREQKPFFYCRFVAKYPSTAFCLTFFGHLILVIVSGILLVAGYELFPTRFDNLPLELYNIPYRSRDMSWRDRNQYPNRVYRTLKNNAIPRYERRLPNVRASVDLWYDSKGGNIFSKTFLKKIQKIENYLTSDNEYKNNFCMTSSSTLTCSKPRSILRYFDGTFSSIDSSLYDPNFNNITSVLFTAYTNNKTRSKFEDFLPKQFQMSSKHVHASITRTELFIGCSVTGKTKCSTFEDKTIKFLMDVLKPKLEEFANTEEAGFDFYYFSFLMWREDVKKQAILDMLFAIGSLFTIFIFMLIHTRSCWITFWAVLSILISFVGTNFIYRVVLDFQYFGYFHILAIFIILGIGADDLFVFYDVWRLTAYSSYPSLAHRLSDAYRKTALSMFITSLTTMTAFIVSAFSPMLATKSFGLFAAILVGYNYISVIVFFPAVVIIYHLKFEKWTWPCCRCCKRSEEIKPEDFAYGGHINSSLDQSEDSIEKFKQQHFPTKIVDSKSSHIEYFEQPSITVTTISDRYLKENENHKNTSNISNSDALEDSIAEQSSNSSKIIKEMSNSLSNIKKSALSAPNTVVPCSPSNTKLGSSSTEINDQNILYEITLPAKQQKHQKMLVIFFRKHYFRFITNKVVRLIMLPIFAGTVAFFAYKASFLKPDNEGLNVYKPDHTYAKSLQREQYSMLHSTADSLAVLYIVFGLELKNRDKCHFSSINCRGKEVYDKEFDPNPVQNQIALKKFCDELYKFNDDQVSEYRIKKNRETGQIEVACFTRDLEVFLLKQNVPGLNLSLPWDYNKVERFMLAKSSVYNASVFNRSFNHKLQIPIQYWLYNADHMTYTNDYGTYDDLIGEQTSVYSKDLNSYRGVTYGNKIKYIGIQINTTINNLVTGYAEGIPVIEKWENFINSQMKKMPKGVNKGFHLTRNTWHWMYVQKSLANNAILGIAIGVSLAFPILTIATMNIIIGFFATLSICCTTICVIGVIPLAGWKLGVLVSLNMCMLVGLAVDYVVHLAEGYNMSEHKDRLSRTRDMLEEMATSVFAGACTTLGASLFMFFTQITFFTQFGIFLFCTVGFSLVFSLGMFSVLMSLIGPENDTGSLTALYRKMRGIKK
ncbi:hypothetical protein KUTeg_019799 [Tegillarca granosa]|uniref:SSD domain-containing protein n=1 Tax=Tegillarca granosa TaxID=220873 RepID=A0ABQ9EJK3_TEGGR|nr:hypothetical protein KUTeg_019799 [Tegillarca granosa]